MFEVEIQGTSYVIEYNNFRGLHYTLVDGEVVVLGLDYDEELFYGMSFEDFVRNDLASHLNAE